MNDASGPILHQRDEKRGFNIASFAELGVLAIAFAIAIGSYFIIAGGTGPQKILTPPVVALLLVANLLPGIALLVLIGRRIAMRRAARSPIGGRARLHVRLVALFSVIAAVPTLFVVVFASLLFQYGVQFWYSDQARNMIENATGVAKTSYEQMLHRWQDATVTSANAISQDFVGPDFIERTKSPQFVAYFNREIFFRSLSDGFLFVYSPGGKFQEIASLNPDRLDLSQEVSLSDIGRVERDVPSITTVKGNRIKTLTVLPGTTNVFYLTVAISDVRVMEAQSRRSVALLSSYRDLLVRSQSLQLEIQRGLAGDFAADRRNCGVDRARSGGSAGPTGRGTGRRGATRGGRRLDRTRAHPRDRRRARHARQRLQPDDRAPPGADRCAGKPSRVDRGGDVRRDGGRRLGRA